MKTSLFIFLLLCVSSLTAHQDHLPGKSVDTVFNKAFPDATNLKWFENDDEFVVYFDIDEVHYQLNFNNAADIKQSIRYYKAENLPPYISARVAREFPELEIEGVTEVQAAASIHYMIVLTDKETILKVKSDVSGNFEVKNILNK